MLLGRLDRYRPTGGDLEAEPHDCLVDAAYLFDRKSSIAQPLTIEQQQLRQYSKHNAIGDARNRGLVFLVVTPFEKQITLRIEQVAFACRNFHCAVAAAGVHQSEKSKQLRPRAVPLIHRVRIATSVRPQPLVKARNRVIVRINWISRKKPTVFSE